MFKKICELTSFGQNYLAASFIYLGLTIIVYDNLPVYPPQVIAQTTGCPEVSCPSGQKCCLGQCIPDFYLCCEDGSNGPPADSDGECFCCKNCDPNACGVLSSYHCESERD